MSIRQEVVQGDATPVEAFIRHPQTKVIIDLTGTTNHEIGWLNLKSGATGSFPVSIVAPATDGKVSGKWDKLVVITTTRELLEFEMHYKDGIGDNHTTSIYTIAIRKRVS